MLRWDQLVHESDEELARRDIAEVNLACAADLPGSKWINHEYCTEFLDRAAGLVEQATERAWPKFQRRPWQYEKSEAYFRVLVLITVLQRDLGVRYNPDKISENVPLDTADTFIHGIIQGNGGTCASMPVVYAAVGRRLGYPIKLVSTKGRHSEHMFARWDVPGGERFNIEATNKGLSTFSDDYYRTCRYQLTPEMEKKGGYLKSLTPREELSGFLVQRAFRWKDVKQSRRAADALAWASALVPDNEYHINTLKKDMNEWLIRLGSLKPAAFPALHIWAPRRRYPATLPLETEHRLLGIEATENLLSDEELENKWWKPMRHGKLRSPGPKVALVDYVDGYCHIRFQFTNRP